MIITDNNLKCLDMAGVPLARELCDRHVGPGLYTPEFLASMIGDREHHFFLLELAGTVAGYIYYRVMEAGDIARMPGFEYDIIRDFCGEDEKIAVLTSIGIEFAYRGSGLTDALLDYLHRDIRATHDVTLFLGPAWKQGGFVPAEKLMVRNGYTAHCNLIRPWERVETLACPYCRQTRCQCNAVVYLRAFSHE